MITYTCPVCSFPMPHPPADYNTCPLCLTEFGYEDSGPEGPAYYHQKLREAWLADPHAECRERGRYLADRYAAKHRRHVGLAFLAGALLGTLLWRLVWQWY